MRSLGVLILVTLLSLSLLVPVWAAPGKAASTVVPQSLYQRALRFQVMAPGGEIPSEEVMLFCTADPTQQQLEQIISAGYTLEAVVGRTILVTAPITLYIDQEEGLDALGFVSFASMQIENSLNSQQVVSTGEWVDTSKPAGDTNGARSIRTNIYWYRLTQ